MYKPIEMYRVCVMFLILAIAISVKSEYFAYEQNYFLKKMQLMYI